MRKVHLQKNVPSAEFLSDEEMKSLTGGLYGSENATSEKPCGPISTCGGDCRFVEDGITYYGTCNLNASKTKCQCYGVGAGPIS